MVNVAAAGLTGAVITLNLILMVSLFLQSSFMQKCSKNRVLGRYDLNVLFSNKNQQTQTYYQYDCLQKFQQKYAFLSNETPRVHSV